MSTSERKPRGFAQLSVEQRRELASRGGKSAHAQGVSHRFTSEEARKAGRKGGEAAAARGAAYMRELGRRGAEARQRRLRAAAEASKT